MEVMRNAYKILVGKSEGEETTWDLEDIYHEDIDWIHLTDDRVQRQVLVNIVMNLWLL
jgi:hypothetical protein